MERLSRDRHGIIGAILVIIVVVIIVIAILGLIFIPFRDITVNESRQSTVPSGVDAVKINLTIDTGDVSVVFVDNTSTAASMTVVGHQRDGILGSDRPVNVTWSESKVGGTLDITSVVTLGKRVGPFTSSDITCTLSISKQMKTALIMNNGLGAVALTTVGGVNLTSLDITTSTGSSNVVLANNTTLSGPLSMHSSLGGVTLGWTNVHADNNTKVALSASTGSVKANIAQGEPLGANITFTTSTSLGGIDLTMDLSGNNSAKVDSQAILGSVSVPEQNGFKGSSSELISENYANTSNFEVTNNANTGSVKLNLVYASG